MLDVFAENDIGSGCVIESYRNLEESLLFASVKGKNTVIGNFRNRFAVFVIVHVNAFRLGI